MKKFLMISALCGLSACASVPFMNEPPVPTTPATPVFFQPFSANLDQPALDTIAAAAKAANEEPGAQVTVIGAADGVGSAAANKYLSKTRAQVVADQLETDGVDPSRLRIRGEGTAPSPAPAAGAAQSARRALIQIGG
jgi:outer membrane protein OmpA-like peptidoglycan-associated protein